MNGDPELFWKGGNLLAIETSCDETSIAILDGPKLLAHLISSQIPLHQKWGGVVPEAAARAHVEILVPLLHEALKQANLTLGQIHGIAVTNQPGLIGALSVGVTFAQGLAQALDIPIVAVDHIEGHLWSFLAEQPRFSVPLIGLIVSGGHTELILVKDFGDYTIIGGTIDDAAGEAFDKSARLLGFPYPGGKELSTAAEAGVAGKLKLPVAKVPPNSFDFSFSGLKTAVAVQIPKHPEISTEDFAAEVQRAIISPLVHTTIAAMERFQVSTLAVGGGVSANQTLRSELTDEANKRGFQVVFPGLNVTTDNAAMIGLVGSIKLARGLAQVKRDLEVSSSTSIADSLK